jgi:hypothetical protein
MRPYNKAYIFYAYEFKFVGLDLYYLIHTVNRISYSYFILKHKHKGPFIGS